MLLIHSNNSSRTQPPPQPQPSTRPHPSVLSQYCAMPSRTSCHCTRRTLCPVPCAGALRRPHASINNHQVKPVNHRNHNQVPSPVRQRRPVLRDAIAHHPQHHSHPSVPSSIARCHRAPPPSRQDGVGITRHSCEHHHLFAGQIHDSTPKVIPSMAKMHQTD